MVILQDNLNVGGVLKEFIQIIMDLKPQTRDNLKSGF